MGRSPFPGCPLKHFVFCDGNCFFDGLLISKDPRVCHGCVGELNEVVVPDRVEDLREECFYDCISLSRVTFRESSSLKLIEKG